MIFPPKRWFGSKSEKVVKERRIQLEVKFILTVVMLVLCVNSSLSVELLMTAHCKIRNIFIIYVYDYKVDMMPLHNNFNKTPMSYSVKKHFSITINPC